MLVEDRYLSAFRPVASRQHRAVQHGGAVHLVLDSTRLQPFGQGGQDAAEHGRACCQWRKLRFAVYDSVGEAAAKVLTEGNTDDAI